MWLLEAVAYAAHCNVDVVHTPAKGLRRAFVGENSTVNFFFVLIQMLGGVNGEMHCAVTPCCITGEVCFRL